MAKTDSTRARRRSLSRLDGVLLACRAGAARLGTGKLIALAVAGSALVGAAWLAADRGLRAGIGKASRQVDGVGGEYVVTRYGPAMRLRRGRFLWSFHRRGRLEPLDKRIISSRARGIIKHIWEEGKPAKKGDVLLELDTREEEEEIAEHEAELVVRKATLVQTERKQAKAVKEAELAMRSAELELEWERQNELLLLSGPTTTELARARADLKTRELVARNREEEYRILGELGGRGFATSAEVERKKLQLIEAKLDLEKVSIYLRKLLAGPDEPEREEARLRVEIAEHTLESAGKKLESVKAMAAGAVMREEKLVRRQEEHLRRQRSYLEKHVVHAPADGYVLHLPTRWGGPWRPGNRVWHSGMRIMSMPVGLRLKAVTKVAASEINHVSVGMRCRVTVAGASARPYEGKVAVVSSQGKDEFDGLDGYTGEKVGKSGRRAFAVEVTIADETPELRPGVHADVEFVVREMPGVLFVPWGAVTRTDAGASLAVIEKGRPVTRPVELGPSSRHAVVVSSGCEEGEIVLLAEEGG